MERAAEILLVAGEKGESNALYGYAGGETEGKHALSPLLVRLRGLLRHGVQGLGFAAGRDSDGFERCAIQKGIRGDASRCGGKGEFYVKVGIARFWQRDGKIVGEVLAGQVE